MTLPPASQDGLTTAAQLASEFSSELLDEAGRIAKRVGAQEASPAHVRAAAAHLYQSGRSLNAQVLSTAGGVIAGGASSAMFSYLVADKPNISAIAVSAVVTLIGAVATTAGLMRR